MNEQYESIMALPHHQSDKRPHMPLLDRAAQFSPFAALVGYGDMVDEEDRITDEAFELAEGEMERMNMKLNAITDQIDQGQPPKVTITYFVKDASKEGGSYQSVSGTVKMVDDIEEKIILFTENMRSNGKNISLLDIATLRGDTIDYIDEGL